MCANSEGSGETAPELLPNIDAISTRNDTKFSDRNAWANSADPDQGLHCLPFRMHRFDSLLYGRAT